MRTLRAAFVATLACLVFAGTLAADDVPAEQQSVTREEAVALVLATDPCFEDLPDGEWLRKLASSNFDPRNLFSSDYVRVLGTLPAQFSEYGSFTIRNPVSWLIEATLVRDCIERDDGDGPSSDTAPYPDPCEWRHSWFYRVQPDGTVSLLFDEGDTTPMPEGDE